jgi:hypothetical protein
LSSTSKTIEIIIAPNGQSKVETKGFTGSECREASRFVEQAIGQQTNESSNLSFIRRLPHSSRFSRASSTTRAATHLTITFHRRIFLCH